MTAGQKLAAKWAERLRGTTRYRGTWETDAGTPGPAPGGNGRASFPIPRLHAPKYRAGDPVAVELPDAAGKLHWWACEIFGVQLPLVPAYPAMVRVRALELVAPGEVSSGRREPCPSCGRVFSVLASGKLREHPMLRALGGMQRGPCPGSGKPAPVRAVSLETARKAGEVESSL